MARRELPPADPLDGSESLIVSQKGLARRGWVGLICEYVMNCIDRNALKGDPGRSISAGSGAPSDPGNTGDLYIDGNSGDLYRMEE